MISHVLSHFHNAVFAVNSDYKRVLDHRKLVFGEFNIYNRSDDLSNFSFFHWYSFQG